MFRITILSFFMACVQQAAIAQEITVPDQPDSFHLFLLVGQSNMAGRGTVSEADQEIHPRIVMLDKRNKWVVAQDPMHFDKPKIVGVGLGRTFALDYATEHPGVTVGLIPCAVGGSPIETWEPGGAHTSTNTHPFDDAISRTKAALKFGVVKGILWHQGESDSTEERAPLYEKKLHALIARFRRDLNTTDVPFIAGQLGQFAEKPWNDARKMVDSVHRQLPATVSHTAFVKSDGLAHRGDQTHFSADAYRKFGHRYYKAFQSLGEDTQPQKTKLIPAAK